METSTVNGIQLYFDIEEGEDAELVRHACEHSAHIIQEHWGLNTPPDCRVYVMTSWRRFIFHSAPWHWKILLALTYPLWAFRVRRLWVFAGGWMQRYGKRCAVGVKPARLIETADRSIGEKIFLQEEDFRKKVQHITCHELTHAFAGHLKLPMWLNEGLAMVSVDKFEGQSTVRPDTMQVLQQSLNKPSPGKYQKVSTRDWDALVYQYVRGYWITRYIEDIQPDILKELLKKREAHKDLEDRIAAAFGMTREAFWKGIDGLLVDHFLTNR